MSLKTQLFKNQTPLSLVEVPKSAERSRAKKNCELMQDIDTRTRIANTAGTIIWNKQQLQISKWNNRAAVLLATSGGTAIPGGIFAGISLGFSLLPSFLSLIGFAICAYKAKNLQKELETDKFWGEIVITAPDTTQNREVQ